MNIMGLVGKVPGGLMLIPMILTAVINTFFPEILAIGDPATATFTAKGTMTVIGMILFITGSQFKIKEIPQALKRGGALCIAKVIIGFAASISVFHFFGKEGFWGISALSFIVIMSSCNPGVYMALVNQYGDNVDRAAFGLLNIVAVPALPILIISASNGGDINYMSIIATLAPFAFGMLLGNLDPKIAGLMAPGAPIILVFMGFCFGASVNLFTAAQAGLSGILAGFLYIVLTIPFFLFVDKAILRRPGYASVACSSVAGISVSVPSIICTLMPEYRPFLEAATAQAALAMVITCVAAPFITKWTVEKFGSAKEMEQKTAPSTDTPLQPSKTTN